MKKTLSITAIILILVILCCQTCGCTQGNLRVLYAENIEQEMKGCFNFFWEQANHTVGSAGYGIISDRWPSMSSQYGSIASIGFGLTAYVIGVEQGYVELEEAKTRTLGTLETMLRLQEDVDSAYEGFFYHFLDKASGKKWNNCEVSTIDTAILLCGALTAGEYFGGEIATKANQLYANANWKAFEVAKNGKTYISMGYKNGAVIKNGLWDWYAEQLMIYVLGAGSPTKDYRLSSEPYYDFTRKTGNFGTENFIYSYFGSIFTYQYSHAWIDFRSYTDQNGTNWFENSVNASKSAYNFCILNASQSESYSKKSWGLTACDTNNGYSGYLGASPRGWSANAEYDAVKGAIAPAGAIGSVVFTPAESLRALRYYQSLPQLNNRFYGLNDSFNLDYDWYAEDCIGIDKGISLLMLANYLDETVWNYFMQNENVLNGLAALGLVKENKLWY